MKKFLSILLATLLVAGMMSFGASADTESVTVSLSGSAQAIKGEQYEVTLSAPKTVGGISGVIDYDEASFALTNVAVTSAFAEVNKISAATDLIEDDGKVIKFALLSDKSSDDNVWITFIFAVASDAEAEKASFTLDNVEVSDADGLGLITEGLTEVSVSDLSVYAPALNVAGATIRTNGEADIRFEADFSTVFESAYRDKIAEVGIVGIPTRFMKDGEELVVDGVYGGYSAKTAKITAEKLEATTTTISTKFRYSSSTDALLRTKYSARAYIKLNDGKIIYSDNVITENNISGGTSSRSCIDVARAVAAEMGVTSEDAGAEILSLEDAAWTVTTYEALIETINSKISQ